MDDLSTQMFRHPSVKIGGYQGHEKEIQAACQVIFGRILTPDDLAELIAAPDGSELFVEALQGSETIELRLGYVWFEEPHDYLIYVDTGRRIVEFDTITVKDEAPELLETRLFARQVRSFRRFGIDQIRLLATGHANDPSGHIGYYVWARLGFVMALGNVGARLAEAGLEYADNTIDLFVQEGGAEWWYNNGSEREAVFYLYEGSPCLAALDAYLGMKGVSVDDESDG